MSHGLELGLGHDLVAVALALNMFARGFGLGDYRPWPC